MKILKNKIIRNSIIYFLLLAGYVFIHLINIEKYMYKTDEKESRSKVNFIYQQF